jgi:hypothetical protein
MEKENLNEVEKLALQQGAVSGSLPFTDEQLLEMEKNPFPSKLWNEAFNFYNADKNNTRLSMSCQPCFKKVMMYLLKMRVRK